MSVLTKRLENLETTMAPKGSIIPIWAMTDNCMPMREKQIDAAIEKAKAEGAPSNARFWPVRWLAPQ